MSHQIQITVEVDDTLLDASDPSGLGMTEEGHNQIYMEGRIPGEVVEVEAV